jgi:hypothetical protein
VNRVPSQRSAGTVATALAPPANSRQNASAPGAPGRRQDTPHDGDGVRSVTESLPSEDEIEVAELDDFVSHSQSTGRHRVTGTTESRPSRIVGAAWH